MARRIRNVALDSKAARRLLKRKPGNSPHYVQIEKGLHLGYRPPLNGSRSGMWELRNYIGDEKYRRQVIGLADDVNDANGTDIFDYWQAVERARERLKQNAALSSKAVTVDDVMKSYLDYVDSNCKDKLNAHNRSTRFILPTFGGRDAASLTQKDIQTWFYKIAKTPARKRTSKKAEKAGKLQYKSLDTAEAVRKRKSTANRTLGTFKAALNLAYGNEELKCNPVWQKVKPFKAVDAARARFLSLPECKRLINAADADFRRLLQAALFTGCRFGELARLTVADFDPGNPSGNGTKPRARGAGRTSKAVAATIAINESKSGKPRHVYLNDEAVQFFGAICLGRSGEEPMLKRGDRAWQASEQARPMKEACERAKIIPPINFHQTRHSYASLAIMNGTPLLVVAHNLGHANTTMCERHYGHLTKDYEAEMIRIGAPSFGIALPKTNVVGLEAAE